MCRYDFLYYEACRHYGIELVVYCQEARFQAAMTGRMPLCRPCLFDFHSAGAPNEHPTPMPFVVPIVWAGILGSCRECANKFVLPPTLHAKSYTSHTLPGMGDRARYDPAAPAPYLYVPRHAATIPELLGLAEVFDGVLRRKQGPRMVFPWRLERSDWRGLAASLPWASQGMWEPGVDQRLGLRAAHDLLGIWGGMTGRDKDLIVRTLNASGVAAMQGIWERNFEPRGMPWSHFTKAVAHVLLTMMDEARRRSRVEDVVASAAQEGEKT